MVTNHNKQKRHEAIGHMKVMVYSEVSRTNDGRGFVGSVHRCVEEGDECSVNVLSAG